MTTAQPRSNPRISYALVALQFVALAVLAVTGPWIARSLPWLLLEGAGLALLLWAGWAMRRSLPNVTPDVRRNATLVQEGPFRFIRHPIYSGVLLVTLALLLDAPSVLRAAAWLLLAATLVVKLHYEERLLRAAFSGYAAYQQTTKRLVPFLY